MSQSLLLHSPPGILGTRAHMAGLIFKSMVLGLKPQSAMWEPSDIAANTICWPVSDVFYVSFSFYLYRNRKDNALALYISHCGIRPKINMCLTLDT